MKVLSYYGAYAKGTEEYDKALEEEEANGDSANAKSEEAVGSSDQVSSESVSASDRAKEDETNNVSRADADEGNNEGHHSSGSGHEDSGVPKFEEAGNIKPPVEPASEVDEEVRVAVMKLDPSIDYHWTQAGIPALLAVEEAMGKAGVTRKDVKAAAPNWDREAAMAAIM
jgi:hypothetical protein